MTFTTTESHDDNAYFHLDRSRQLLHIINTAGRRMSFSIRHTDPENRGATAIGNVEETLPLSGDLQETPFYSFRDLAETLVWLAHKGYGVSVPFLPLLPLDAIRGKTDLNAGESIHDDFLCFQFREMWKDYVSILRDCTEDDLEKHPDPLYTFGIDDGACMVFRNNPDYTTDGMVRELHLFISRSGEVTLVHQVDGCRVIVRNPQVAYDVWQQFACLYGEVETYLTIKKAFEDGKYDDDEDHDE